MRGLSGILQLVLDFWHRWLLHMSCLIWDCFKLLHPTFLFKMSDSWALRFLTFI